MPWSPGALALRCSGLLVLDLIQIKYRSLRIYIHIGGPAETAADIRKVLAFQINALLLPLGAQNYRAYGGDIRIRKLPHYPAQLKLLNPLSALLAPGPKGHFGGLG